MHERPSVSLHSVTEILPVEATMQHRKQVGLLGGSFNPVHLAHLVIAEQVGQSLGLDAVYLMPSFTPPHVDEKKTLAPIHRLHMLECAIEDNPMLAIETSEIERGGKSYTYDTLVRLKAENPNTDYYFIIGGDMVDYLPTWYKIDELLKLVQFVGIKRPNFKSETDYPIIWVDIPQLDISSTAIRKKIKQGCSVRYLVPDRVIEYIHKEGIYLDDE